MVPNLTEICKKNFTSLNETEIEYVLDGLCDESTYPDLPTCTLPLTSVFIIFYVIFIVGGVVLNILIQITIFRRNRLRTVTNAFMVSLSVGDFLMATVIIPLRISERLSSASYVVTRIIYPCIGVSSISSLSCVTLDRYLNIMHALNYEKYMNKSRAVGIITSCWIFSILQSCVYFLIGPENTQNRAIFNDVRSILCFGFPAIFIFVVYTKLFLIAREHSRNIAITSVRIPHCRPFPLRQDTKILTVVVLLVGTFIVGWFPFLFAVSYELHHEESELSRRFCLFKHISECILMSTCVLNPIMSGLLRRDLRISLRYVAACKRESIEEIELY